MNDARAVADALAEVGFVFRPATPADDAALTARLQRETVYWAAIHANTIRPDCEAFLAQFSNGHLRGLARNRRARRAAKLLDFGLAGLSGARAGLVGGTVPYLSPEALGGEPAAEADDVWALGVTLYERGAMTLDRWRLGSANVRRSAVAMTFDRRRFPSADVRWSAVAMTFDRRRFPSAGVRWSAVAMTFDRRRFPSADMRWSAVALTLDRRRLVRRCALRSCARSVEPS